MRPLVFFSWIEQVAFVILLYIGRDELGIKWISCLAVLWLASFGGLRFMPGGTYLWSALVAILDVVLVLVIFKEDVVIR